MIERWGALVGRRPGRVLGVGLLLVVLAAVYGAGVFGGLVNGGFEDPDAESYQALAAETDAFGHRSVDVVAIYTSDELTADEDAFVEPVREALAGLPAGSTASVVPWWEDPSGSLVGDGGHAAQVLISLGGESDSELLDSYDEISGLLVADGDQVETHLAGTFATYDDVNQITADDLARAEAISMPVVLVLALVIFGSVVAALMPVTVGLTAVVGSLALLRLVSQVADVSVFAVNIVSLLGIGLAIDYALFVVSRFREELATVPDLGRGRPDLVAAAVQRTLATAGRTVLFSGLTVAASLASLLVFPQSFMRSMAYGGVAAVLVAMVSSLTLLPAILRLLGHRVEAGRMPWRRRAGGARPHVLVTDAGRWAALARAVMRRPVLVAVTVVVGLLVVASPFLGASFGSMDYRVLPPDAPSHRAAVILAEDFGGEVSTASIVLEGTEEADVADYVERAEQVEGVTSVATVDSTAGSGDGTEPVTLLTATWEGNSQTEESQDVVRALREVEPASGTALVGGLTAATVDLVASVAAKLPVMGLIVLVVMFVLLFGAFGSFVLPVKAVVMNLFSITASFGVVTWIFADGHLSGLLGFTPQGFLDATNPILMLAILFGLSMDYEVFLLSRVREEWDASGDNDRAVEVGLQRTGQIITSAALLLGVVIGAFSLSDLVFMKMIGLGMLVALLLDATVVRALLVPATMKLLGRWNWWAPAPLARWWERHGLRGH
ncbi:MMPL family transporter [Nocardioides sp. GY 10127]|uniref:MMPL family transporter n=1 Tax=Nocardioides sp. GY 10127 TaxID=2569762 RepID=UPI0010A88507|nr:MMPL family transporter [Nocardioides sp. GY 10127]TIC82579.1 MMPL family transporter [Nocardioides sp. GY 10127]